MEQSQRNKLLEDIENLRRSLNGSIELGKNATGNCGQAYTISCHLDKLFCKYMKAIYWK